MDPNHNQTINLSLLVYPWPELAVGEDTFLGYPVAMGIFRQAGDDSLYFAYADFEYGDTYVRYRLPNDSKLRLDLLALLHLHVIPHGDSTLQCKVVTRRTETGYIIEQA